MPKLEDVKMPAKLQALLEKVPTELNKTMTLPPRLPVSQLGGARNRQQQLSRAPEGSDRGFDIPPPPGMRSSQRQYDPPPQQEAEVDRFAQDYYQDDQASDSSSGRQQQIGRERLIGSASPGMAARPALKSALKGGARPGTQSVDNVSDNEEEAGIDMLRSQTMHVLSGSRMQQGVGASSRRNVSFHSPQSGVRASSQGPSASRLKPPPGRRGGPTAGSGPESPSASAPASFSNRSRGGQAARHAHSDSASHSLLSDGTLEGDSALESDGEQQYQEDERRRRAAGKGGMSRSELLLHATSLPPDADNDKGGILSAFKEALETVQLARRPDESDAEDMEEEYLPGRHSPARSTGSSAGGGGGGSVSGRGGGGKGGGPPVATDRRRADEEFEQEERQGGQKARGEGRSKAALFRSKTAGSRNTLPAARGPREWEEGEQQAEEGEGAEVEEEEEVELRRSMTTGKMGRAVKAPAQGAEDQRGGEGEKKRRGSGKGSVPDHRLPMLPPPGAPQVVQCQACFQTLAVPINLPPPKKGQQKLRCGKCLKVSRYAVFSPEQLEAATAGGEEGGHRGGAGGRDKRGSLPNGAERRVAEGLRRDSSSTGSQGQQGRSSAMSSRQGSQMDRGSEGGQHSRRSSLGGGELEPEQQQRQQQQQQHQHQQGYGYGEGISGNRGQRGGMQPPPSRQQQQTLVGPMSRTSSITSVSSSRSNRTPYEEQGRTAAAAAGGGGGGMVRGGEAAEGQVAYGGYREEEEEEIMEGERYSDGEEADDAPRYTRRVVVNGVPIEDRDVARADVVAGPIQPGTYWYDARAGFWGVMGGPCLGIIPSGVEELAMGPLARSCSGGRTRILVNGRELHRRDLDILMQRGLPESQGCAYVLDIDGNLADAATGALLPGLGKLAPSLEMKRRGTGMYVPR